MIEIAARHGDRAAVQLADRRAEPARPEQREHERERERADAADRRASGSRARFVAASGPRSTRDARSMPTGWSLCVEQRGRPRSRSRRSARSMPRITRWPERRCRDRRRDSSTGSRAPAERRAKRHGELAAGAADQHVGGQRALDAVGELAVERHRQHARRRAARGRRRRSATPHARPRDRRSARASRRASTTWPAVDRRIVRAATPTSANRELAPPITRSKTSAPLRVERAGAAPTARASTRARATPRAPARPRDIAVDELAALGELHGLVAEPLDRAQDQVEPDGELAVGVVAQAGFEATTGSRRVAIIATIATGTSAATPSRHELRAQAHAQPRRRQRRGVSGAAVMRTMREPIFGSSRWRLVDRPAAFAASSPRTRRWISG